MLSVALTFDGAGCQALSWIKSSIRQTYVLSAFVLVAFFYLGEK